MPCTLNTSINLTENFSVADRRGTPVSYTAFDIAYSEKILLKSDVSVPWENPVTVSWENNGFCSTINSNTTLTFSHTLG